MIITESSCKHKTQYYTNNFTEMGQLIPEYFHSLITVVPVTDWEICLSWQVDSATNRQERWLRVTPETPRPQSCLEPPQKTSLTVDAPHLRLCCFKSLSFTITLLCHRGKCWKWHVASTVRLITLVRRTGRTWGLHHSTSNFLFKIANSTEATARLKTHFTLCLNQSTLPEPDIDRDPLTCCKFTYWSPHLHALSALMINCGLRLILTLNESKWVINNIRTLPEASKLEGEKSFQRWHGLNFTWGSNSPAELFLLIIPPKKYNVEYNVPLPWKMCFLLVPPVDCLGLTL